ncbi:MAG: hypothetical protein ACOY5B_18820 [Spirochaetota bacterium]
MENKSTPKITVLEYMRNIAPNSIFARLEDSDTNQNGPQPAEETDEDYERRIWYGEHHLWFQRKPDAEAFAKLLSDKGFDTYTWDGKRCDDDGALMAVFCVRVDFQPVGDEEKIKSLLSRLAKNYNGEYSNYDTYRYDPDWYA